MFRVAEPPECPNDFLKHLQKNTTDYEVYFIRVNRERDGNIRSEISNSNDGPIITTRNDIRVLYKTPTSSSTWGPREGEIVPSAPPLAARQYFQLGHFGSLKCHFWTNSKLCRDQLAGRTDGKLQQVQLPIVDLPRKSTTHEEPTTKTQN